MHTNFWGCVILLLAFGSTVNCVHPKFGFPQRLEGNERQNTNRHDRRNMLKKSSAGPDSNDSSPSDHDNSPPPHEIQLNFIPPSVKASSPSEESPEHIASKPPPVPPVLDASKSPAKSPASGAPESPPVSTTPNSSEPLAEPPLKDAPDPPEESETVDTSEPPTKSPTSVESESFDNPSTINPPPIESFGLPSEESTDTLSPTLSPNPPPPAGPRPVIGVEGPTVGASGVTVKVQNKGDAEMSWVVTEIPPWALLAPGSLWEGKLAAGDSVSLILLPNPAASPAPDENMSGKLLISGGSGNIAQVPISAGLLLPFAAAVPSSPAAVPSPPVVIPSPPKVSPAVSPAESPAALPGGAIQPASAPSPAEGDSEAPKPPEAGTLLPPSQLSTPPKLTYKKLTQGSNTAFQLGLQNVGGGVLEVQISGPDWVAIIPPEVSLGENQKATVDIQVGASPNGESGGALTLTTNTEDAPVSVTFAAPTAYSVPDTNDSSMWLILAAAGMGGILLIMIVRRFTSRTPSTTSSATDIELATSERVPLATASSRENTSDWDNTWSDEEKWDEGGGKNEPEADWGDGDGWGNDDGWGNNAADMLPIPTKTIAVREKEKMPILQKKFSPDMASSSAPKSKRKKAKD